MNGSFTLNMLVFTFSVFIFLVISLHIQETQNDFEIQKQVLINQSANVAQSSPCRMLADERGGLL